MKPALCLGIENGIWHSKSPSCMCFLNPGVLNLLDRSDSLPVSSRFKMASWCWCVVILD